VQRWGAHVVVKLRVIRRMGEWWYSPTHSYPVHAMEASGTREHSSALGIGGLVGPRAGLDGS